MPFFLGHLLPAVQALPPGTSLTESYDSLAANASAPHDAIPDATAVPLAPTHPSPSSRDSDAERTSRPTRRLSQPVYSPKRAPPIDDIPSQPSIAAFSRTASPAVALGSVAVAPAATSTPSTRPQMPIDWLPGIRPDGWVTCNHCKRRKQRCVPPAGSAPSSTSCTRCLRNKVECVRGHVVHRAYRLCLVTS